MQMLVSLTETPIQQNIPCCASPLMLEAAQGGPRFHHQPEVQHPKSSAIHKPPADYPIYGD
jgi:hypothetical protein